MATTPTNHWKVGLFVVVGIALTLCAVVYLGVQSLRDEHVRYHAYFDEPIQGLEVGAPIEFRGVKVGQVADIGIAPDRRHVDVTCALFTKNLHELGLAHGEGSATRIEIPPDLRVQLAGQGITGLKILQIDFFDVASHPAPVLPFAAANRTIPAAVSTLKSLEKSVTGAADRVPEVAEAVLAMTQRADRILAQLEAAELGASIARASARAEKAFTSLQVAIDQAAIGKVSAQAQASLTSLDATLKRANAALARLDGDGGLIAAIQRTTTAIGDLAASSPELGEEFTATLREMHEAATAFRRLIDALERNPDMLLKGRGNTE